jgi:dienelactone hydrolase
MRDPAAARTVRRLLLAATLVCLIPATCADGPGDNLRDAVRPIPPPGIQVPDDVRVRLSERVAQLGRALEAFAGGADTPQRPKSLLPDIRIFHKAVDWALRYDEFFHTNEFAAADRLLDEASRRLGALEQGRPYWLEARGLVVRGYVSRIDGSVQPYGLVVPESYNAHDGRDYRLDFWFHGRGEKLTELAFLDERMRRLGEFAPRGAFVLHPYGRYCNGARFAGETDAWEALADVQRRYPIDEDRLVVRGFSLGGAACWHLATHHAWRWAAAAPGAGFSETAEFLRVFQNEDLRPSWWEQKLWRLYDSTDHALNVGMVPLVAYSGEKDRQIQAAQAMEKAMAAHHLTLLHVIGPDTAHRYEPNAREEINHRVDALAAQGRVKVPPIVRFTTHTLRYPRMAWVTLDGLERHWEPAWVEARFTGNAEFDIRTRNVTGLTLRFGSGEYPFPIDEVPRITVDGQLLNGQRALSDRSWSAAFWREEGRWGHGGPSDDVVRKRHGLQGPIDDAFMDAFLFVRPTGRPLHPGVARWVESEFQRAVDHWRRHFRGDVSIRDDTQVTLDDMTTHHLVLWGDPGSNRVLARIAPSLPISWDSADIRLGADRYDAKSHAPILIYPNVLAGARRYIVVNSSFTFRDYDYLNNARQTPKLPDWAIVDLTQAPDSRQPGRIVNAGFFDESWRLAARP